MVPKKEAYDSDSASFGFWKSVKELSQPVGLIPLLVRKDLTVRYKRSLLGMWWSLLNPLLTTLTLYIVFNNVFKIRMIEGASFAPYLLSGVLMMGFFTQGVSASAESIASGAGVLTKVYVPAQVFAISSAIAGAINLLIGLLPLALVTYIAGSTISPRLPLVFVVVACLMLFVSGIGQLVAIAYIRFDDMRSIVSLLLMISMYTSPVFYPKTILTGRIKTIVEANPLTSYLDCFRWAFNNGAETSLGDWIFMTGSAVVLFWIGTTLLARSWPRLVTML